MSAVVTLPYDPVWQALDWAKENCPSYITNAMAHHGKMKSVHGGCDSISYYFGEEKDAVFFALRWLP